MAGWPSGFLADLEMKVLFHFISDEKFILRIPEMPALVELVRSCRRRDSWNWRFALAF